MSEWQAFYDRTSEEVGRLKDARPELADLLGFYAGKLDAQRSVRERFDPDVDGIEPPLRPEDVEIDWVLFGELFDKIGDLSRSRAKGEIADWASVTADDDDAPRKMLEKMLRGRPPMEDKVLANLVYQSIVPFLEAYAEKLRDRVDDSKWQKGTCPICGGAPLMARLEEETGRRQLQCQLCRTVWSFKRLECPFCGCEDQKMLRYFYNEDDSAYRVDVCDDCRGYLKTVDMRKKNEEIGLIAEDFATIHLDVIAEKETYSKGARSFAEGNDVS